MSAEPTIGTGVITEIATLDRVLRAHAVGLGDDFVGYRNHAYRVANFCVALTSTGGDHMEKIAVATAFHDLGIWTDGTFNYLAPSVRLAKAYLTESGRPEWIAEVERTILEHHKLSASRADPSWLVEPFRKADYKDRGKGRPIVFSHGWPLSSDDWDAQMMFFLEHGYRVIAHDWRGHGRSTQTGDGHDMWAGYSGARPLDKHP